MLVQCWLLQEERCTGTQLFLPLFLNWGKLWHDIVYSTELFTSQRLRFQNKIDAVLRIIEEFAPIIERNDEDTVFF